jgi:hypothetical protein
MPLVDLRQARREIRLGWVLGLLGWHERERRGEQVRGACPLHGPTSPRSRTFSAHLGRGVWQCFRCRASGNVLDLWAKVTGQGLYPSVLDLYDRLGRGVPWLRPVTPARLKKEKEDDIDRPRA